MSTNNPHPLNVIVEEDLFPRPDESAYILKTPARQMRIAFVVEGTIIHASSYISMIGGTTKQLGETTALYVKANDVMQRVANETGRTVHYTFGTRRPKLALWAQGKGNEIFSWDKTSQVTVDPSATQLDDPFMGEKYYYPVKKSEYA